MSEWRKCKLSDVALKFAMGPFGSNIKAENFTNTGVPVIRGTNLNYYRYVDGEFVYLTEEKANQLKSSNCFPGDIVITHRGTLGQVGLIPFDKHDRYVVSQSGMKVTVNPNFLDSNFLLYFFKSNIGQNELLQHESQVGVPSISNPLTSLKSVSLNLPPIEEQKAITSVLSSLDDKIDLLHRQNKTLEAMAETLFRQWFVEETQEDLEEISLGDAVETTSGGTPSRSKMEYYEAGSINWVKSKELSGGFILETEEMIRENALKASSAKLLPANSILIAMYGATVGEYAIISKEMTCNQAVCAIKPNENYPYTFLFMFIKINKGDLINMAVGSAQQNISQQLIKTLKIPTCKEKINKFHQFTDSLFQRIKLNTKQIRNLETLRDTLLPKLMNGEVRVIA